jgi:hypothetical protein
MSSFIKIIFFLNLVFQPEMAISQVVKKNKKQSSNIHNQVGIIQSGGTSVYPKLSFDSDPVAYLNEGDKVKISRKKYKGLDGFGLFYKVILSNGKSGFISDVEVIPQFTKTKFTKKEKENPDFEEAVKDPAPPKEPLLFTRYLAVNMAMINYKEEFVGQDLSASTPMYGLKLTGPGYLFEEVPLDIDILVAPTPPSYYDEKLATAPSTGFLLFTSMSLKFPFLDFDDSQVYYSLGIMGNYSKFNIRIGNSQLDNQELKIGLVGGLGAALRFARRYFIQSDARYYYEKTNYLGYSFSFGLQY